MERRVLLGSARDIRFIICISISPCRFSVWCTCDFKDTFTALDDRHHNCSSFCPSLSPPPELLITLHVRSHAFFPELTATNFLHYYCYLAIIILLLLFMLLLWHFRCRVALVFPFSLCLFHRNFLNAPRSPPVPVLLPQKPPPSAV